MINLQLKQNLRYMRNKKATWILNTLFYYKEDIKVVLIKNSTNGFGNEFPIKEIFLSQENSKRFYKKCSLKFDYLEYKQNIKFWLTNKKGSQSFLKNNYDYINKIKFNFIFSKYKVRRFYHYIGSSRKVKKRLKITYTIFNKNLESLLIFNIIYTLLLNLEFKYTVKVFKNIYIKLKLFDNYIFFYKQYLFFKNRKSYYLRRNKYIPIKIFLNFKFKNINSNLKKHKFYFMGFLIFFRSYLYYKKNKNYRKKKNFYRNKKY